MNLSVTKTLRMNCKDLAKLFLLALSSLLCAGEQRSDVATRSMTHTDVIFTESLLWTVTDGSVVKCAVNCLQDPSCVCFTVVKNAVNGKAECRGHSTEVTTASGQRSPGSSLYVLTAKAALSSLTTTHTDPLTTTETSTSAPVITTTDNKWLNKSCSWDTECTVANSECFYGRCLCTPGFYYSKSTATCVYNCGDQDLQTDFVFYPNCRINDHSLSGFPQTLSLLTCFLRCLSSAVPCRTIDYMVKSSACGASDVTRNDVSASEWLEPDSSFDHYQRMCV